GGDALFALRTGAEVLRVERDVRGAVGVVYRDEETGHEAGVRARHIIGAASAIASTKILLASAPPPHPLLGAYLNDHALLKCRVRTNLDDAPASVIQGAVVVGAEHLLDRVP